MTHTANRPAAAHEFTDPVLQANISLDQMGLVSEQLHVEPDTKAWTIEAFNDRARGQLHVLEEFVENAHDIEPHSLSQLVDAEFESGPLRPSDMQLVFHDDAVRVWRAAESKSEASAPQFRGTSGFAEALAELMRPFRHSSDRVVALEIVHGQVGDEQTRTMIRYQMSGQSIDGFLQQTAVWHCVWTGGDVEQSAPRLKSIRAVDYEESWGAASASNRFSDCTESVLQHNEAFQKQLLYGVDHWLGRIERRFGISPSGWQGVAVGDVNGDGLDDVYVCQSGGTPNRLFVQMPDGTANDQSAVAGVDWWDHSHAALLVDLDNDADQDLVVATSLGLIIMANDGRGHFSVAATKLCPEAMPFTLAAADYDGDGDLDLYASCYAPRGNAVATQFLARPIPYHDANNGGRNCMFRNDRDWKFTDVTRQVGLDANNRRFSLAAAWEDYDNDGDLDLYVANDYGRNNLYRNDKGRFTDVAQQAGVEDISAGMSVSWGDYNRDGFMDLYVSNMWSSAGNRVTYQRRFHAQASDKTRSEFQRHARGNSLFMNAGDGTFRDASIEAGVTMGRWAWGSRFMDMNNDGFEDIVVMNGFITQEDPRDL